MVPYSRGVEISHVGSLCKCVTAVLEEMHRAKTLVSVVVGKKIHEPLDFAEFFIVTEKGGFSVLYKGSLLGLNFPSFIKFIDGNVKWACYGAIGMAARKSDQPNFRTAFLNDQMGDLVGHLGVG